MPIPTTGFLAQVNNTNQPPENLDLPVSAEFIYKDGGASPYQENELTADDLESIVITLGNWDVSKNFGFNNQGEFGFEVIVNRRQVYGFIMLDYLDPPFLEQFVQLVSV